MLPPDLPQAEEAVFLEDILAVDLAEAGEEVGSRHGRDLLNFFIK